MSSDGPAFAPAFGALPLDGLGAAALGELGFLGAKLPGKLTQGDDWRGHGGSWYTDK